jgi:hypothetical protein
MWPIATPQAENFSCEPIRRPIELRDHLIARNLRGLLALSANANASATGDVAVFDVMPLRLSLVARCHQIWFGCAHRCSRQQTNDGKIE